ncbi:DUF6177 family protein [Streptomyces sp. NPDC050738]|uniref:DUF6177 family protein n=1 Tax=Streptomyces sp. NPDC050738 TaxID=3154744 RepID=UPI00342BFE74
MTKDVIALTPNMPDAWAITAGLHAGDPDLNVATSKDGAVIQLCGPGGHPLVSIEAPMLIHTPGETQRLLNTPAAAGPVWWTEVRASTAVPEAHPLAASFAGRLSALLGGTTWPPNAKAIKVVPLSTDVTALPAPDEALPAVDVLTDSTAVVLTDRPVLALTTWLADILRTTAATDRALQIVTPPHVRLTQPLRTALTGAPNRWVIQDPECGYCDGLSGAVLRWQNGTFAPASGTAGTTPVAPAFTAAPSATGERQLILSFRTHHTVDDHLILGQALETTWRSLTGAPPVGWGSAEPINLPWSTRQLTDLARSRAPKPSLLTAIGNPERPAIATLRITRTTTGIEEDATLALGYTADETPPLEAIEPLANTLVTRFGLTSMLAQLRTARRDLTTPPHLEAPPIPVSFTLGPQSVTAIGLTHARRPPLTLRPIQLGHTNRPALHYPFGNGTNAHAWNDLQQLTAHLGAAQEEPRA